MNILSHLWKIALKYWSFWPTPCWQPTLFGTTLPAVINVTWSVFWLTLPFPVPSSNDHSLRIQRAQFTTTIIAAYATGSEIFFVARLAMLHFIWVWAHHVFDVLVLFFLFCHIKNETNCSNSGCVDPPLEGIPTEDWICTVCEVNTWSPIYLNNLSFQLK